MHFFLTFQTPEQYSPPVAAAAAQQPAKVSARELLSPAGAAAASSRNMRPRRCKIIKEGSMKIVDYQVLPFDQGKQWRRSLCLS
jgi:hypothetical protein